jgi:hypothetical protein
MAKVSRVGSSFSTLPFDGIDNVANLWIHDDFIGSITAADIGTGTVVHTAQGVWNAGEVGSLTGPGTLNQLVGVAGHPGILQLQTADDASEEVALLLGAAAETEADDDFVLDSNGLYIASILRVPDVDGQKVEFGLIADPASPNSSAVDVVSFVWDADDPANVGDEFFIAQVNAATVDTEEVFTLPYVENDWVLLELYATDSDAYFRMTTEDGQETIHLAGTMPIVGVRPGFINEAEGSAVESLDIDAFHLRYSRRPQAANAGISWLGATGA